MPITPYSAPLQYEYKPLNLMAFAAPLSKMQEEFDITTDAIESSDFDLQHLSLGTDPERAQALLNTVKGKRDELAKNLAETKNYKQAATKLKQLNTAWKNDPELKALQSNYAAYSEMVKTAEENVKSNYWNQEQANEWLARAKRQYKGANFEADQNNPKGTYTSYGLTARGKNLDKEFEEMVWNIAKAIPEHKYDTFAAYGIDPDTLDKEFVKTIVEETNPNEAAAKISGYLKTIPRFRQYFEEAADYKFDALKNAEGNEETYKALAANLNDQLLQSVNGDIAQYQKLAKKDPSVLTSPEYLELVDYKNRAEQSKETGVYDDELTRQLYMQDQVNDRYNMQAVGNVIGYKNVTHDHIFRATPKPKNGGGSGANEDGTNPFLLPAEDMKFNIFSIKDDIAKAKKNLHGYVVSIDNISGGAMREVVLGSVGSNRRKKLTNDDAAIYEAQLIVRNAAVTSKNVDEFRKKIKDGGMNPSTRLVEKLYKDLTSNNSVGLQELNDNLAAGEVHYNSGRSAAENYKFIQQGAYEDKDIKKVLSEVATLNPFDFSDVVDIGDWGELNPSQQAELKQIRHVFSSRSYSQEQLKKAGINTTNNRAMGDFITGAQGVLLTYDEVAKLHGYKNFQDAILKGYDFGGVKMGSNYKLTDGKFEGASTKFNLGSTAKEIQQNLLAYAGNKGLEVNKMSYDLINDQQSQEELGQAFSTINKVIAYAGTTSYQGMPGFDKKGNPLPGTKIDVGGNKQPLMTLHGGQVYVQVPYAYKGGEGMITIKPKTGTEDYIYSALDRIDRATEGSTDRLKKQTNTTIKNAKFVQVYGNTINDVRANSPTFNVDKNHPEKTLGVISVPDPMGNPMTVEVVKRYSEGEGGGTQAYYTVKYPGGKYVGRYTDVNALRADIMIGR
jgi:hypothetical protein